MAETQRRLVMWQLTLGRCLVCGTPIQPPGRPVDEVAEISTEITVNHVRACLYTHHLLAPMQACHVVDLYTQLPDPAPCRELLRKYPLVATLLSGTRAPCAPPAMPPKSSKAPVAAAETELERLVDAAEDEEDETKQRPVRLSAFAGDDGVTACRKLGWKCPPARRVNGMMTYSVERILKARYHNGADEVFTAYPTKGYLNLFHPRVLGLGA